MADYREQFTTEIYVNQEQAANAMEKLRDKVAETAKAYEKLLNQKDADPVKTDKARKAWEAATKSLENAERGVAEYQKALKNLTGQSMDRLLRMQRQINSELKKTKPDTAEWQKLAKEYAQVTNRIKDLRDVQDSITTKTKGFKGVLEKVTAAGNKFGTAIMALPTAIKGVTAALSGVINVTKQVVNASQTMGDKWRNGMAAMKTTTDAFFMALSTGDWSAFNDGITGALKKARELAEHLDTIADYGIAEGVMQSEYVTDYNQSRTVATDTEANAAARQNALRDMENDIQHYSEFVEAKGKETWETLQASFDAWKGLQFDTSEEMHEFVVRYFEYATTGRDKEAQQLKDLKTQMDDAQRTYNRVAAAGGSSAQYLFDQLTEAQQKYYDAYNSASKATQGIVAALELPDDKKKEIANLFSSYAAGLDKVEQMRRRMNTTRDQVTKQINQQTAAIGEQDDGISIIMADIDAWVAKERQAALDRYNANKDSFDKSATAYQDYQDELAAIDAEAETKRESARQKEEARLKAEADKRKAAADKAYQNAQNKIAKAEAAQLNTLKSLYANGIMDKQTYEAQKAVVEEDYLKQRMATAEKYGKDTDQFMSQLLDRQIARMEKARDQMKDLMDALSKVEKSQQKGKEAQQLASEKEDVNNLGNKLKNEQETLEKDLARVRERIGEDTWKEELDFELWKLNELHDKGLVSERDYLNAKAKLVAEYAQKEYQELSQYAEMATNFVTQLKEMETAQLESEYQAQLTAAGDNAEQREAIEAEYEQKKLDLQKKYADTEMVINIAKAIAAGALAAVEAFAAAGNPILGAVFAAIVAATTALEVATIVKQRNAIKNSSVNSSSSSSSVKTGTRTVTGYSEGGFTDTAPSDHKVVGVVHANEYVAPAWMVRQNPVTFANLERYRKAGSHGRSGSISRGLADGGFTTKGNTPKTSMADNNTAIEEAVYKGIRAALEGEWLRAYLVRKDLSEMDEQDARFKAQTSRG